MQSKSDKRYRRLELFIQESEDASSTAVTDDINDLKAFHRKIGSNFFLFGPERVSDWQDNDSCLSPDRVKEDSLLNGGEAADARINKVTPFSENDSFSGETDLFPIFFDVNKSHPNTVSNSGKRVRKIRKQGLPVMMVRFQNPWKLLADFKLEMESPAPFPTSPGQNSPNSEFWWRWGESNPRP